MRNMRSERITMGYGPTSEASVSPRIDRPSVQWALRTLLALGLSSTATSACAAASESKVSREEPPVFASPPARAVVDAPDRSPEDRQLDASRRPAELLTFLRVAPGMRVGELVAGAGYTAELLARAVAPGGTVYAENPRLILEGAEELWAKRLSTPAAKNIVRVDRELDDPFPPEARDLDLVVINLVYHDTVWMGVDRERMNRAVFAAIRNGGTYAVIDHSARPGAGVSDAQTLHRIDEAVVRSEVQNAGFVLKWGDSFLRNPSDMRDWNDSPNAAGERRGKSDRFALLFAKP
jgi:predicted methyltransferase